MYLPKELGAGRKPSVAQSQALIDQLVPRRWRWWLMHFLTHALGTWVCVAHLWVRLVRHPRNFLKNMSSPTVDISPCSLLGNAYSTYTSKLCDWQWVIWVSLSSLSSTIGMRAIYYCFGNNVWLAVVGCNNSNSTVPSRLFLCGTWLVFEF